MIRSAFCSSVKANSQFGNGSGGDISVITDNLKIRSGSQIATQTLFGGDSGEVYIESGSLNLTEGGIISTEVLGSSSSGGDIIIYADEVISISGFSNPIISPEGEILLQRINSGIVSSSDSSGNAGDIRIQTHGLRLEDGGVVSSSATNSTDGRAGDISISAKNSVEVLGPETGITATSSTSETSGDVLIDSNLLTAEGGAQISVEASGSGDAGTLILEVNNIKVIDGSTFSASTTSGEGDIAVVADKLLISNNSSVVTEAVGDASGGRISIQAEVVGIMVMSKISADAEGPGGRVSIISQGIFLSADSSITATSESGPNLDGDVTVDTTYPESFVLLNEPAVEREQSKPAQGCEESGIKSSRLISIGKGGVTESSSHYLSDNSVWEDVMVSETTHPRIRTEGHNYTSINKPVGLSLNADGEVVLISTITHPCQNRL